MPDLLFAHPRLAAIYDDLDADRSDLDHYVAIAEQFGAHRVLDVGCGTGTLACTLALRGFDVVGVDPAAASLDVAGGKPGAELVTWLLGDVTALRASEFDLATMTGNVAQVFLDDRRWADTLRRVRSALAPAGRFVFESRDPARRAWREWTPEATWSRTDIAGVGPVESWVDVDEIALPFVSFRSFFRFDDAGDTMVSRSTLRFRERDEIETALLAAGLLVCEIRDAPDRPDREFVFVAEVAAPS